MGGFLLACPSSVNRGGPAMVSLPLWLEINVSGTTELELLTSVIGFKIIVEVCFRPIGNDVAL